MTAENITRVVESALEAGEGILRLTPTWVPRSFLHPGRRIRLHPDDYYALGTERGGIDERWFASTTEAQNEGRQWHEGLSFCVFEGKEFLLRDAIAERPEVLIGAAMWNSYRRWPVYSKFFDNLGPIPHHMHQGFEDAALVGQEGKPESYYFPPQYNNCDNHFPYTFMGLEPGTKKSDIIRCLEKWQASDNGILELSKAYKLKRGTGWLIPPGVLHAPGSLCTYEPQWGSDVFGMFQNIVEGRFVPWSLLVKDMPKDKHADLDFIISQLDWDKNIDPNFKQSNYLEPIVAEQGEGWVDRWIVYGTVNGRQLFSARELTVLPRHQCRITDPGASGWITVQGTGRIGRMTLQTPSLIRFGERTSDEVFISHDAAKSGYSVENTGDEPLVGLRYFGPDVFTQLPQVGDHAVEV
ncbi:MAG TPA: hypothetical protein PKD64_06610 [Pirellulaceae bacterium]|nr:hypothetical protein [Pirellulaceae bacterium]HMO91854.1 hypothetical protein [Pirellulaceae bacterium]HMP69736.1 hypothetical protein [Pirellulaceae bacterium]